MRRLLSGLVVAGGLMLSGCGDVDADSVNIDTEVVTEEGHRFVCFIEGHDGLVDCEPLPPG